MANDSTTEDQKPTGTPLVSQEMIDAQPDPEDLRLLTNAELAAKEQEDGADSEDATGRGADQELENRSADSDEPTETDEEDEEEAPEVELVDDPGEFVPADYSFDVTVYDQEGKNGKQVKVASLDEWDALLETEPNLGSSAAVLKANRAAERMDRGIERDRQTWETKKAEYDEAAQAQEAQTATVNQWVAEMDYLIGKGELPPISNQLRNANWSDPTVAKNPAVKAQVELLNYMKTENAARVKAGLQPMQSVLDAFQGFAREREKQAAATNRRNINEARRQAGGKVASSAPRPATTAPKGIAVGRIGVLN